MPKGYWIVNITVTNPQTYETYRTMAPGIFAKFQGRFLVRSGPHTVTEGTLRPRIVVVEFPSLAAATDCYNSPEYQSALTIRQSASQSDFTIAQGWEGQP